MSRREDVIVLKLSGAAMTGGGLPWDGRAFEYVAQQISAITTAGTRCGVVIGGGNFIRAGMPWGDRGMDSSSIDQLGMMGSGWNAQALARQLLRIGGLKPRLISRAEVASGYAQPWDSGPLDSAADEVVIVAAGIGKEGVSTDIAAPLLAIDMGARLIVMSKNGVDGLYDGDPNADYRHGNRPQLLPRITTQEALDRGLQIMDRAALEICRDNGISVHIVGADRQVSPDSLRRAAHGEPLGSILLPLKSPISAHDDLAPEPARNELEELASA